MIDRNETQTWNDATAVAAYNRDYVYRVRVVFPDMWNCLLQESLRKPLASVMDYGCGSGLFFENCPAPLKQLSFTGYDISPPMLNAARETAAKLKNMAITITDTISRSADSTFDVVTCIAVWPNWSSYEMCIENLKRIRLLLKRDAIAIFAVTNPQWIDLDQDYEFRLDLSHRSTPGFQYEVLRRGNLHKNIKPTVNYNWPLDVVESQLRQAGFHGSIEISEYPPTAGIPHSNWARVLARPTMG